MENHESNSGKPKVDANAMSGELGEAIVEVAVLKMGQLYNRNLTADYGVDGTIELTSRGPQGESEASGRQIGVQVKRGLSVATKTRRGRTIYCSREHANYWLGHSLPIIVVHCEPESDRIRWAFANAETLRATDEGYAIDLPEDSDFATALPEFQTIADVQHSRVPLECKILRIVYSLENGIMTSPEELGLDALGVSRAALRGENYLIEVELLEETDLIAAVDAVIDTAHPTIEQRRIAIVQKDVLHRLRQKTKQLRRALDLLLSEPLLAEMFNYRSELFSAAICRILQLIFGRLNSDAVKLVAWPQVNVHDPQVVFDIRPESLSEFYGNHSANAAYLRMGDAGGVLIGDLPHDTVVTSFLPAFAVRMVHFADSRSADERALVCSEMPLPILWAVGLW